MCLLLTWAAVSGLPPRRPGGSRPCTCETGCAGHTPGCWSPASTGWASTFLWILDQMHSNKQSDTDTKFFSPKKKWWCKAPPYLLSTVRSFARCWNWRPWRSSVTLVGSRAAWRAALRSGSDTYPGPGSPLELLLHSQHPASNRQTRHRWSLSF